MTLIVRARQFSQDGLLQGFGRDVADPLHESAHAEALCPQGGEQTNCSAERARTLIRFCTVCTPGNILPLKIVM